MNSETHTMFSFFLALLDPEDENLQFVFGRQDVKPLAIYRIQFAEYLICYNGRGSTRLLRL